MPYFFFLSAMIFIALGLYFFDELQLCLMLAHPEILPCDETEGLLEHRLLGRLYGTVFSQIATANSGSALSALY